MPINVEKSKAAQQTEDTKVLIRNLTKLPFGIHSPHMHCQSKTFADLQRSGTTDRPSQLWKCPSLCLSFSSFRFGVE